MSKIFIIFFVLWCASIHGQTSTGAKHPSATGEDYNSWNDPSNGYASDNSNAYALWSTYPAAQDFYNYNLYDAIPDGATIDSIALYAEVIQGNDNPYHTYMLAALSGDGGSTYSTVDKHIVTSTAFGNGTVFYMGGSSLWGLSWTKSNFSNTNFRARFIFTDAGGNPYSSQLDDSYVIVYYTEEGYEPPAGDTLYVDPSGNDTHAGTTKATAIATPAKASTMFADFDVIAFSDTAFYGTLAVHDWDGTSGAYKKIITWNKYGTGKRFKIKGLKQLTSWTSLGGNKWSKIESTLPNKEYFRQVIGNTSVAKDVYFLGPLIINNQAYQIGRYPNTGYLDMSTVDENDTYFTDTHLSLSTNQFQGGVGLFSSC